MSQRQKGYGAENFAAITNGSPLRERGERGRASQRTCCCCCEETGDGRREGGILTWMNGSRVEEEKKNERKDRGSVALSVSFSWVE